MTTSIRFIDIKYDFYESGGDLIELSKLSRVSVGVLPAPLLCVYILTV